MLPLREINRRIVLGTLARHGGNKRQTAVALGVSLKTIYNMLNRYEMQPRYAVHEAVRHHDVVVVENTSCVL